MDKRSVLHSSSWKLQIVGACEDYIQKNPWDIHLYSKTAGQASASLNASDNFIEP